MRPAAATLLAALLAAGCSGSKDAPADPEPTACTPDEVRTCYGGPPGTQGVGTCQAGSQVCAADGSGFGPCDGEVLPVAEVCGNTADDDCNGAADDVADADGDGWTRCDGDCDDAAPGVNPGAYELLGNEVDDDCSGAVDELAPGCSGAQVLGASAAQLAAALDLCQVTTANPPLAERRWGLIAAALTRADGARAPDARQVAVKTSFGSNVHPQRGSTMAVLSSGTARNPSDPNFEDPFTGYHAGDTSEAPADLLAAHGGALPAFDPCWVPTGTAVHDSVRLALTLRAPTNAGGLRFRFKFYSADYPQWICSPYDDAFLAQLGSSADGIPADRVIALSPQGHVITVNDGLIESCTHGDETPCPYGTMDLQGTGFLSSDGYGGATAWLQTFAPVVPGELITLTFTIWDTHDHISDSTVLLDDFGWVYGSVTVGTSP